MTEPPVHATLDTVSHLRALLEVTRLVRTRADLPLLFDAIARTICDSLGYRTVSINSYRSAWDDFEVVTVHGSHAARAQLLGQTTSRDSWAPYFDDRFLRAGAYVVPEEEVDWEDPGAHIPDFEPSDAPDAWRPGDALLVPLRHSDGHVLGIVSVDEPESGRRPDDAELAVLVALAAHVASAIEDAQDAAAAARGRNSLTQLLEVSSRLAEHVSVESMLDTVARGIRHALRFEKVVVAIEDERGRFAPRGTSGWMPGEHGLDFTITHEQLAAVLDPAFEVEGCYLLPRDEALARAVGGSSYASRRNGRGPLAWNRHWLLVPLHDRSGRVSGFVWVDDPEDRLLPSAERLAALRTFANQAAAALLASIDFETLSRRNSELAALHQTTIALLDRLDLDSVLEAIVDNARSLVGTKNAYLYLVEDAAEELRLRVRLGKFESARGIAMRRGEGLAGRVWESGRSLAVDDYATWSGKYDVSEWVDLHSTAGVPLRIGGEVRGVLGVSSDEGDRVFGPGDVALLERFAQLASLALENAHLYAALAHSEELHRRVLEHSAEIVAVVGLDGCVVVASPSTARAFGIPLDDLAGTPFVDLVHPDDVAAAQQNFARVVGGETSPITVRGLRRDGSVIVLEAMATPIPGPDGRPQQILATARDITVSLREEEERVRLEEQLRQAQKMESIGLLAGGIAHDFNNLLTAIVGYAELGLLELEPESPARDSLQQIARAADRAASLTSQLLAFSRKQVLHPRVLDLNEVVGQMARMLARMLGEDVILSTALEPGLGRVRADPTQIEQVVLNLAINARDSMPEGGSLILSTGTLDVRAGESGPRPDLVPGGYVTLSVRDSGVGMHPELAERIFEPFFTTKGIGEGTGLGLATVHGIVSQSGGAIWVESVPGEGSCFTVALPRVA